MVGHSLFAGADFRGAVLVEAVFAIEIAVGAGGFYKERKRLHRMIIAVFSRLFHALVNDGVTLCVLLV